MHLKLRLSQSIPDPQLFLALFYNYYYNSDYYFVIIKKDESAGDYATHTAGLRVHFHNLSYGKRNIFSFRKQLYK